MTNGELRNCVIGYTGFVGNKIYLKLKKENPNTLGFNTKNIHKIKKGHFNEVFCAALPAKKWIANKNPTKDFNNIKKLVSFVKTIKVNIFYLISTIDCEFGSGDYGKNRLYFENFVKKKFKKFVIIRLPALFGKGLKKNILYDLINNNQIEKINIHDQYQWFDLDRIFLEIKKIRRNKFTNKVIKLYSEPVSNKDISKLFPKANLREYSSFQTKYNIIPSQGYYATKKSILKKIKNFIKKYES